MMLLDSAKTKATRVSKMVNDSEYIIKRNYLLMQLNEPEIPNHVKLKINDAIHSVVPQLVKYKFQRLFVEDKLWGQILNMESWITEFIRLDRFKNSYEK